MAEVAKHYCPQLCLQNWSAESSSLIVEGFTGRTTKEAESSIWGIFGIEQLILVSPRTGRPFKKAPVAETMAGLESAMRRD